MWLEIVKEIMPYLYFTTVVSFIQTIATFRNKERGYMSEKQYYHGLHEAIEKIIARLHGEKVDKDE